MRSAPNLPDMAVVNPGRVVDGRMVRRDVPRTVERKVAAHGGLRFDHRAHVDGQRDDTPHLRADSTERVFQVDVRSRPARAARARVGRASRAALGAGSGSGAHVAREVERAVQQVPSGCAHGRTPPPNCRG